MLTQDTTVIIIEQDDHTPVTLTEMVERISAGQELQVLSRDRSIKPGDVVNTRGSDSKDFVYIGTENHSVILTPDHKVYEPVRKEWMSASMVSSLCYVLDSDNNHVPVVSTHTISDKLSKKTITLTVSPGQCFFANNILVHNER